MSDVVNSILNDSIPSEEPVVEPEVEEPAVEEPEPVVEEKPDFSAAQAPQAAE